MSLPIYRCARGSTLPESFPLHRQPVHPWYSNRLSQCPGRNTVTASSCISRFWSFLPMKALAMLPLPVSVRVSTEYGNATVKSAKWTGHMQNSAPSWISVVRHFESSFASFTTTRSRSTCTSTQIRAKFQLPSL